MEPFEMELAQAREKAHLLPEQLDAINSAIEQKDAQLIVGAVNSTLSYEWLDEAIDAVMVAGNGKYTVGNPIFAAVEVDTDVTDQIYKNSGESIASLDTLTLQALQTSITEKVAFAMVKAYARDLPRGEKLAEYIASTLGALDQNEPNYRLWRKVVSLGSEAIVAKQLHETLHSYDFRFRDRNESEYLMSENDALFESIKLLQKYQLKPALVRSSGVGAVKDWMVLDWQQMRAEMASNTETFTDDLASGSGSLTRIYGTKREFVSRAPLYERHGHESGSGGIIKLNFEAAIKGNPNGSEAVPDVALQLNGDGELVGMRGIALAEFADKIGMRPQFELLRGEVLALYCDLVLPSHLVAEAHRIEKETEIKRYGKQREIDRIRNIVMARVKLFNSDPKRIEKELNSEYRKNPERHEVIGFIRSLPRGFRASFEARELCRKYLGKELAEEGETFVIPHERGGNEYDETTTTTGHRAVRRYVGGSVVGKSVSADFNSVL